MPDPSLDLQQATFVDADALRSHLNALNESGIHPVAVGIDNIGAPFLITLVGPYAEHEDVFFDSPWQNDISYGERVDGKWVPLPPRCDECNGHVHSIDHLDYPVTVLLPPMTDDERQRYDRSLADLAELMS